MVPISKDRTSASKKINLMALIRTLTVSTIAFERKREELYGFRQTVKLDSTTIMQSQFYDRLLPFMSEFYSFRSGTTQCTLETVYDYIAM